MPRVNDRIGPYQLISKLGKGAFGEVWLAKNVIALAAREVALKIPLDDEIDLDTIRAEAAIWIKASGHANVLPIIEANVYDDYVVIASEYAPDGSLEQWLKNHGGRAPSIEAAIEITSGILAGLEYLHARKIIHRDLKPANILLQGATPRIADFGISRVFKSTSQSAVMAGTPAYMAPEAFSRRRNEQTDLWSVGVMLYQIIAGRLPFVGQDMAEMMGAIINEEPEPLPASVPDWLWQVVAKALKKNPAERYQSAGEMRSALIPRQPTVKEISLPQLRQREPKLIEPQPQPASPTNLRPVIKWGAGLAAIIIALTTYLATKTPSPSSPSVLNAPSATPKPLDLGEEFTENINGVKLEMVRVPGGSFLMGSPDFEEGRHKDEGPQHQVTVPSFYIGKYEVLQAQWKVVMGDKLKPYFTGHNLPMESISWNDAQELCRKLSTLTGKIYRLPSEAEWEYACRAGTTEAYAGDLDVMAWYANNSGMKEIDARALWNKSKPDLDRFLNSLEKYGNKPHSVGLKQANTFKLHDMYGNVREWCEDVYHDSYGGQHGNPPSDGSAWTTGGEQQYRVVRNCSFVYLDNCRSALRSKVHSDDLGLDIGMRVVVSARTQ
jgi:formylglycine-generating enzyme required for sulfatase activity